MKQESRYWNDIYTSVQVGQLAYDDWLDKHQDILNTSKDVPILDLGCGLGCDTLYLKERDYPVISCDLSQQALQRLKEVIPTAVTQQVNMLEGLPFATGSARVIIADLSLHYFTWTQTEEIRNELQRVLAPGGALLCRVNSIHDVEFGAGQGEEIEPNLFEQEGRRKRFFDAAQLELLFKEWSVLWKEETTMHRYGKPKRLWELAAVYPKR